VKGDGDSRAILSRVYHERANARLRARLVGRVYEAMSESLWSWARSTHKAEDLAKRGSLRQPANITPLVVGLVVAVSEASFGSAVT